MSSGVNPGQSGLRVAVLSDIHGNIRALNAVLEEVEREHPDRIVVCGDVAAGPFPGDIVERLMKLGKRARFIRGNADREIVSTYDSQRQLDPQEKDPARLVLAWCAQQIDQRPRDFLASFVDRAELDVAGLGSVLFCHGSPRSDEEIITYLTPEAHFEKMFAGLEAQVVVCGHTHHQFDRTANRYRVINPGSVGMPYQGQPGAFWAILGPGVELRRTEYTVELAVEEALSAGYPDSSYSSNLLTPPKAEEAAAFFEKVALERGERNR